MSQMKLVLERNVFFIQMEVVLTELLIVIASY